MREMVHVAGAAGLIEQTCTRCGLVLTDAVPHIEGRVWEHGREGWERVEQPVFFTPGVHVAVTSDCVWITREPANCQPEGTPGERP
jgi:hypothetical protein